MTEPLKSEPLASLKRQLVRQEFPHRKITYVYSKGTAKASCSCGWQSKVYMMGQKGSLDLESEIGRHKATKPKPAA